MNSVVIYYASRPSVLLLIYYVVLSFVNTHRFFSLIVVEAYSVPKLVARCQKYFCQFIDANSEE